MAKFTLPSFCLVLLLLPGGVALSEPPQSSKEVGECRKAAEKGDSQAQLNLGDYYMRNGEGKKNFAEAAKWFRKSADQGNAEAQFGLSSCYRAGLGVELDEEEALKWTLKAAEQGHVEAQYVYACFYDGYGKVKDPAEAAKWYRKAAEQGFAAAQSILGDFYCEGKGVVQNFPEAVKWLSKAATQGSASAQWRLGLCYASGQGVEQDYAEAANWFYRSAEQGNAKAQHCLGLSYATGRGVKQNYPVAVEWFRKSAEQGNVSAQDCLARSYEGGHGVIKDIQTSYGWYLLASAGGNQNASDRLLAIESNLSPDEQRAARTWAKNWKSQRQSLIDLSAISPTLACTPGWTDRWPTIGVIERRNVWFAAIGGVIGGGVVALLLWVRRRRREPNNYPPTRTKNQSDMSDNSLPPATSASASHNPQTPQRVTTDDEPLDKQKEEFNATPMVQMGLMTALPDCDQISNASGQFGECVTNPIPVNGHLGTFAYLSRLRGRSGVGFMWHRLRSEKTPAYPHPIDVYELVAIDASEWRTLYFGIYHRRRSTMVPEGLTLLPWSKMKDIERVMAKTGCPGHNQEVENFPLGLPAVIAGNERLNQLMPDLGKTMAKTVQKWIDENRGKWAMTYRRA